MPLTSGLNRFEHLMGPGMIALGQPWLPKRCITPGSTPGASIAPKALSKLPLNSPVRLPTLAINSSRVSVVYTKSVGKFVGRWIPIAGWVLVAYDFWTSDTRKALSLGASDYYKMQERARNGGVDQNGWPLPINK